MKTFDRGMIHLISPIFHGESNGDIFMIVQLHQGTQGIPFNNNLVKETIKEMTKNVFDMIHVLWSIFHGESNGDI